MAINLNKEMDKLGLKAESANIEVSKLIDNLITLKIIASGIDEEKIENLIIGEKNEEETKGES